MLFTLSHFVIRIGIFFYEGKYFLPTESERAFTPGVRLLSEKNWRPNLLTKLPHPNP